MYVPTQRLYESFQNNISVNKSGRLRNYYFLPVRLGCRRVCKLKTCNSTRNRPPPIQMFMRACGGRDFTRLRVSISQHLAGRHVRANWQSGGVKRAQLKLARSGSCAEEGKYLQCAFLARPRRRCVPRMSPVDS